MNSTKTRNVLAHSPTTTIPSCPFDHPLHLRSQKKGPWLCDGALFPGECLASCANTDYTINAENALRQNGDPRESQAFTLVNDRDNLKGVKEPRYSCDKNCDFNLCGTCFRFLSAPTDDDDDKRAGTNQQKPAALAPGVAEMVLFLRKLCLERRAAFPPLNRHAFKRAIHCSGYVGAKWRCEWLLDRLNSGYPDINAPIFVKGDICDETLFDELNSLNVAFSEDACKKALFLTGNKDAKTALHWLIENIDDPLLNAPIRTGDQIRRCPKGHFLVPDGQSTLKRWICDGEDDPEGCRRGVTHDKYFDGATVRRFVCEMPWCGYNVCDDCIFRPSRRDIFEKHETEDTADELKDEWDESNTNGANGISQGETYQFANMNGSGAKTSQHFLEFEAWATRVKSETRNAKVVSHHVLKTPIQSQPAGKSVKDVKLPSQNQNNHHKYIVLGLRDHDGKTFYLSAEKDQKGVSIQLHDEFDYVAKCHLGIARDNPVEINSRRLSGIHRLECVDLPAIVNLLHELELTPRFDLYGSNCQTLARVVKEKILKASNGVELHLPGTDAKASINDFTTLIPYFETRYPGWKRKRLVRVPEIHAQFALGVARRDKYGGVKSANDVLDHYARKMTEMEEEREFNERMSKHLGYEGICKALEGEAFAHDTKVIMFHVGKEKALNAPKQKIMAENSSKSISEAVRNFWRENFELMAITSRHGVLIFQYCDTDDDWTTNDVLMASRADMLQDLGQFNYKCISTISIGPRCRDPTASVSESVPTNYGFHFHVRVSESGIVHELKMCVEKIASHLSEAVPKSKRLDEKLKILVTKIALLQNMENETNLVHHKLEKQEDGKQGVMLWTEAQRACIELGKHAFSGQEKPLRLLIRGCQGSGKTLLLMRLAKEYIRTHEDGWLLIHVEDTFTGLIRDLKAAIDQDATMKRRVIAGTFNVHPDKKDHIIVRGDLNIIEIDFSKIGAICFDEMVQHLNSKSKSDEHIKSLLRSISLKTHVVMTTCKKAFTVDLLNHACSTAKVDFRFEEKKLEGNLRSSHSICRITEEYQRLYLDRTFNIPITAYLNATGPAPSVTQVDSANRSKFMDRVLEKARESLRESSDVEINVLCVCHNHLIDLIRAKLTEEERERIKLSTISDVLGCQFPVVVLAIDIATILPTPQSVTDMLTRVTTLAKIVINISLSPLLINGRRSFASEKCRVKQIPSYLRKVASEKKVSVFVYDVCKQVPEKVRSSLSANVDFKWWLPKELETRADIQNRTRWASVVIDITKPKCTNFQSQSSFAPVIELVAMSDDARDFSRDYDQVFRKPIIKFFSNYPC